MPAWEGGGCFIPVLGTGYQYESLLLYCDTCTQYLVQSRQHHPLIIFVRPLPLFLSHNILFLQSFNLNILR
ncbi:hypothetical protein N7475_007722 [Penicillium sp. IBT 31633x]|nr:hypothetical protein N7475_007722 [Penicillium sp. IBT 31633x]